MMVRWQVLVNDRCFNKLTEMITLCNWVYPCVFPGDFT